MKKFLAITLAFLMILGLVACGQQKQASQAPVAPPVPSTGSGTDSAAGSQPSSAPQTGPVQSATVEGSKDAAPASDAPTPELPVQAAPAQTAAASRMVAWFDRYLADGEFSMDMEIKDVDEIEKISIFIKGGNMYASLSSDGELMAMLKNSDGYYVLIPGEKMGFSASPDEAEDDFIEFFEDFDRDSQFSSGQMDVDGKSYYYEEFKEVDEDGKPYLIRYCFDGDELVYAVDIEDADQDTVKFSNVQDKVDDSVFVIPSDYSIMSF